MKTTIHLPFPPPLSACYKNVRRNGRAKTTRYLTWQRVAETEAMGQPYGHHIGPVRVSIVVGRPDKRRRDLDNLLKPLLDLLTHIAAFEDDSQVVDLRIRWGAVVGAQIEIETTEENHDE